MADFKDAKKSLYGECGLLSEALGTGPRWSGLCPENSWPRGLRKLGTEDAGIRAVVDPAALTVPRKGLTIPSVQRTLDSESKERLAKVLASRT